MLESRRKSLVVKDHDPLGGFENIVEERVRNARVRVVPRRLVFQCCDMISMFVADGQATVLRRDQTHDLTKLREVFAGSCAEDSLGWRFSAEDPVTLRSPLVVRTVPDPTLVHMALGNHRLSRTCP